MEDMRFLSGKKTSSGTTQASILRVSLIVYSVLTTLALLYTVRHSMDVSNDPLALPHITPMMTQFQETMQYQSFSSDADLAWDSLTPENGGFWIDDGNANMTIYGFSMFHQLHCLQMFRRDFQNLFAQLENSNASPKMDKIHTMHCFDYLRQVFLCYADGTLEPAKMHPTRGILGVNGMVPHSCGNPDAHYEKAASSLPLPETTTSDSHDHGHARSENRA